jgi:hypothetical protein
MIIPDIIGATGIVTKGLKKNVEATPGTTDNYAWNITHNTGSTVVRNIQDEKCQEEKACDERHMMVVVRFVATTSM